MYYGKNVLSKFPEKFVFSLNDADADALIPGVSVAALTGNTVYYTDSVKDTCQVKPYVFPEIEDLAWFVSAEPAKKAYAAKEYETALRLYEELAEKGFARAQFECGWIYYNGKGTPPNLEAALRWFEKAAALEHKDAQFRCAQMYYNGEGTAPNQAKALHWYEKAAMQGHKDAQFECGKLYHHGKGVAHDIGKAVDWFQKAAQQGIVKAMYNLAVMYYNGDGMPTDMKAAYTWFEQAANRNHVKAQYKCAEMLYNGDVPKNREQARMWLQRVASQDADLELQWKARANLARSEM